MLDVEAGIVLWVVPRLGFEGVSYELFEVTFRDVVWGLDFDGEDMDRHIFSSCFW